MFDIGQISLNWAKQEGLSLFYKENLKSTNACAKEKINAFETFPALVLTSLQKEGRGRGNNLWASGQKGKSLTMSLVFELEKAPQPISSPCFGWATYRALSENFDLDFSLKAPNDIYIEKHKVGGILLESISQGEKHHLVFGLGINVFENPKIDNSGALIEFAKDHVLQGNQWVDFMSSLYSYSTQAAIACQEPELSETLVEELEVGLKAYENNEIKSLEKDGGLLLNNLSHIKWSNL